MFRDSRQIQYRLFLAWGCLQVKPALKIICIKWPAPETTTARVAVLLSYPHTQQTKVATTERAWKLRNGHRQWQQWSLKRWQCIHRPLPFWPYNKQLQLANVDTLACRHIKLWVCTMVTNLPYTFDTGASVSVVYIPIGPISASIKPNEPVRRP